MILARIVLLHMGSIALSLFLSTPAPARDISPPETTAPLQHLFRIGFLPGDPESQLSRGALYSLREFLLERASLRAAMAVEGISDIVLQSADSRENLIQRMNRSDFDLVFCSSVDFVTQRGDYEARFQLRRPEDSFDARGNRFFHKGVVFVNNRSPLFSGNLETARLADYFDRQEVAMVGSSAAAYFYPGLKIASLSTSGSLPRRVRLCESSEEVVKTVINGLNGSVEVGACDSGVIEKVLERNGLPERREELIRVILETDPIPTDPVALKSRWLPRVSVFGRELSEGLRQYFAPEHQLPRLENSSSEKFDDLRENVARFWRLQR
jgi:ABC-type phosphate/phosphonate transport system substrate-binding protein